MSNPFVFLDNKNKKMHIVFNTICRTIKFSEIEDNEDFFYELNRKFSTYEFFSNSQEIEKKDFKKLVEDIGKSQQIIEERQVKSVELEEQIEEDKDAQYIMSNTPSTFFIDELGMEFKGAGDYYDLENYNEEKLNKNKEFKYFVEKGWLIRASMNTIQKTKEAHIAEKRRVKEARNMIVDREGTGVKRASSDGDSLLITDEGESVRGGGRTVENQDVDLSEHGITAKDISDTVMGTDDPLEKFLDPSLRRLLRK